jgi:hypothetical protein
MRNSPTPVNSAGLTRTVQYATVNLTLTQLLALYTTPISVAAPGAGKLLEFLSAVVEFVYGSAAFTIGSAIHSKVQTPARGYRAVRSDGHHPQHAIASRGNRSDERCARFIPESPT